MALFLLYPPWAVGKDRISPMSLLVEALIPLPPSPPHWGYHTGVRAEGIHANSGGGANIQSAEGCVCVSEVYFSEDGVESLLYQLNHQDVW